ncbi:uncharacterized protein LOC106177676 isoform X1 [Lingula anatina]|uniref:Uncharacterized protein LOC106177676 isoform X1 n=1 Tax=Lingula anatina TaxID=7574 RepID=A0A1S3K122_LINAN|nr:uncharacterized protein LOC106177676 isoform X1 [Lingula anatina]|eukprot:XP_013415976.1 uncharacterized protein LOC106177676 isoform X1 [Lingula anatina]
MVHFLVATGLLFTAWSAVLADEKTDLNQLMIDFYDWRLQDNPQFATTSGESRYGNRLENLTIEAYEARKAKCEDYLARLDKINRTKLEEKSQLNYDVTHEFLKAFVSGYDWHLYNSLTPINFLEGPHIDWDTFIEFIPFKTKENYESYLQRLQLLPSRLEQIVVLMRRAIELNRTNHNVSMDRIPGQIADTITNLAANETKFYSPFLDQLASLSFSTNDTDQLRSRGLDVIRNKVQPAYANLSDFITNEYLPNSRIGLGVSSLDRGSEYYKACLKWHVTTDLSPEEVHEKGWNEIRRISTEMKKILAKLGFSGSIREFVDTLKNDTRFFYNTSEQLLAEYKKIANELIPPQLPKVFKDIPHIPFDVRPMAFDGPDGQYFLFQEGDTYGPGYFEVNLRNPKTRLTPEMVALTLHELEPGHHFQTVYQVTENLPTYRKNTEYSKYYAVPFNFPFHTAYTEGWALYAEALGEEMGVYRNDYELFGRYSSEIFRACRLVADTGLHYFNWTKEHAVELFANYTANSIDGIKIEVDRYVTWPGQACAYKIGELKIKELRKKAEDALGAHFDLKEFHNRILKTGPVPLSILETVIDGYIRESKPTSEPTSGAFFINAGNMVAVVVVLCHITKQSTA